LEVALSDCGGVGHLDDCVARHGPAFVAYSLRSRPAFVATTAEKTFGVAGTTAERACVIPSGMADACRKAWPSPKRPTMWVKDSPPCCRFERRQSGRTRKCLDCGSDRHQD
jgi:hypothetical protein